MPSLARGLVCVALVCVAAAPAAPSHAAAPAVQLGHGFVIGPADWYPDFGIIPPNRDPLFVVGRVAFLLPPFDVFSPWPGSSEYTFALSVPYSHAWTWDDFENWRSGWGVGFASGWLRIYKDPTPDRVIGDAASYQDGELLLDFRVDDLTIRAWQCESLAVQTANLALIGGTLQPLASPGGSEVEASLAGEYVSTWLCNHEQTCEVIWPGQVGCLFSDVFLAPPVPARPTTWGRIKGMYR